MSTIKMRLNMIYETAGIFFRWKYNSPLYSRGNLLICLAIHCLYKSDNQRQMYKNINIYPRTTAILVPLGLVFQILGGAYMQSSGAETASVAH